MKNRGESYIRNLIIIFLIILVIGLFLLAFGTQFISKEEPKNNEDVQESLSTELNSLRNVEFITQVTDSLILKINKIPRPMIYLLAMVIIIFLVSIIGFMVISKKQKESENWFENKTLVSKFRENGYNDTTIKKIFERKGLADEDIEKILQ